MNNKFGKLHRILVVRYGTIGDTVFSLPFYRELRNHYDKNCIIDAISDDEFKYILESSQYIDNIINPNIFKLGKFFKSIKLLRRYDRIYFLRKARTLSLFAFWAGIKDRVGLNIKGNKFLTKKIFYNENKHVIDLYLDVLRTDGIKVNNSKLDNIFVDIEHGINIENKFIAIQAFSRGFLKDWNVDSWKVVIEYLTEEIGFDVVLLGSDKDFRQYEKMCVNSKVHNLAGKTTLKETVALIDKSDCFVGIDSGLIHIAVVLKKESILIHGSTSLTHWAPLNNNCKIISKNYECSPCCFKVTKDIKVDCKVPKCIYAITPNEVIATINAVLNSSVAQGKGNKICQI